MNDNPEEELISLLRQGKTNRAFSLYSGLRERDSEIDFVNFALDKGYPHSAKIFLEKMDSCDSVTRHELLFRASTEAGLPEFGEYHADIAIEEGTNNVGFLIQYADFLTRNQKEKKAERILKESMKHDPRCVDAHVGLAQLFFSGTAEMGELEEKLSDFGEGIRNANQNGLNVEELWDALNEARADDSAKPINIERITYYLKGGECKDVREVIQCSRYTIRGCKIIRSLGIGATKKVFYGYHELQSGPVAIKVYVPTDKGFGIMAMRDQSLTDAVRSEFSVRLSKTRNPNINPIENAFYDYESGVFVTIEPACKGALHEIDHDIRDHKPIPADRFSSYLKQVVNGLYGLKMIGKIHGDIKFPNILVSDNDVIRLTDFGQSPSLSHLSDYQDLPNVGYPTTMAPELLCSEEAPSEKSDIWSVGVICYHMATGEEPFPIDFNGTREEWTSMTMEERIRRYDSQVKKTIMDLGQDGINERIRNLKLQGMRASKELVKEVLTGCLVIDVGKRYSHGKLKRHANKLYKEVRAA